MFIVQRSKASDVKIETKISQNIPSKIDWISINLDLSTTQVIPGEELEYDVRGVGSLHGTCSKLINVVSTSFIPVELLVGWNQSLVALNDISNGI